VSVATVRKWLGRYLAQGEVALRDRSSRPRLSPRAISPATALAIVEVRRHRLTQARIAASLGVSKSTVGRVLARAGLSHLKDLEPIPAVVRYEHEAAGDLLHIDTKRLGRIVRPGHRVTGDRSGPFGIAGWEFLFVAIDDHARIGFTDMYPDETKDSAVIADGQMVATINQRRPNEQGNRRTYATHDSAVALRQLTRSRSR
jgi:hypothetical protein